jgi:N-acetylated-alpha-linked acidic dipeptidase
LLRLSTDTKLPFDYEQYTIALTKYARALEEAFEKNYARVSITPLYEAIKEFENSRPKYASFAIQGQQLGVRLLNDQLAFAERYFINISGIPGREWYRHMIYAPGEWTGYVAQVFPIVYEALDKVAPDSEIQDSLIQVCNTILNVAKFWKEQIYWK